ncbi:unnamed protein product, partial [Rotaria sordida]
DAPIPIPGIGRNRFITG